MDEKRVVEIRARAEAATSGPWTAGECTPFSPKQKSPFDESGAFIYGPDGNGYSSDPVVVGGHQDEQGGAVGVLLPEDAEFIAHARQDIPDLLVEVERLREIRDVAETIVESAGPVDKVSVPSVPVPRHDLAYLKQLLRQYTGED